MKKSFTLLVSLCCVFTAYSQTFFDAAIKKEWKGTGTLMSSEATFEMKWTSVLDGQFYQLEFMNERKTQEDTFTFRAIGFYQIMDDGSVEGTWFDSRGITFPLKGKVTENELVVNWGTPETEVGKTIYTIQEDNTITAEDFIEQNGESIPFGIAEYR